MVMDLLSQVVQEDGPRWRSLQSKFWSKVAVAAPTECWNWTKGLSTTGYGRIRSRRGTIFKAHRVAFAIHNGIAPAEDKCVCHSCDNRKCCNHAHLFLGTKADNTADMIAKGRFKPPPHKYGHEHHKVKITEAEARAIIQDKRPARLIAQQYGISAKTVYLLRQRKTWVRLSTH